jgi:hypothetical protein
MQLHEDDALVLAVRVEHLGGAVVDVERVVPAAQRAGYDGPSTDTTDH